jgi:hypothetical protein
MKNKVVVPHQKGFRHVGKTKWSEVRNTHTDPIIDEENPEIAFTAGKVFIKPSKKNNR